MMKEEKINGEDLELRMFFFVPYNISPIQMGIQAGHALGRYCLKYGRYESDHIVWDFLEKWETFIILNGGTTNDERNFEMIPVGTLNLIADQLEDNDIEFACMVEPDLNRALSAVSFICDERVFNYKDYPDLIDFLINEIGITDPMDLSRLRSQSSEYYKEQYPRYYKNWVKSLGGSKNVFLRELIKGKKLA